MNIDFPLKESLIYRRKAINALAGNDALYSDSFSGIINWRSDPSKQPTEEQIQAKLAELQADYDAKKYQRDRKLEYPTIEELVVALYDESDKASIIERRNAVKAKYPKPE
jgi:hypothetical protein